MQMKRAKKPRRTQEERSAETRSRLLNATIELLIERGYARLTTADIAKRAGVSNGARVHHFPTKERLVVAANQQAYENAVTVGTLRSKNAAHSKNPIRDCFDDLLSVYFGDFFLGSFDSVVAARTDNRLARHLHPIVARYHASMRTAWVGALQDAGYSARDAYSVYSVILGTVRGLALRSIRMAKPKPDPKLIACVERMLQESFPLSRKSSQ